MENPDKILMELAELPNTAIAVLCAMLLATHNSHNWKQLIAQLKKGTTND